MEENEPDFISPHRYLKNIYLLTADYPHYLAEARSEAVLMHDSSALAIVEATEKGFAAGGGKGLLKTSASNKQSSMSAACCRVLYRGHVLTPGEPARKLCAILRLPTISTPTPCTK